MRPEAYKMEKLIFLFCALPVCLTAQSQGFSVTSYAVDITLHQEGHVDVVEKYDLLFEVPKHGIYRDIQTDYLLQTEEGERVERKIKISNIAVPGYKFEAPSALGQKLSSSVQIKIGDADATLEGAQHYEIRYSVENAFLHGQEAVQFYWNIKPDNWQAPFYQVNFKIHLPSGVEPIPGQYFVYSENIGNTVPSEDFITNYNDGVFAGESTPEIVSSGGEPVTVLLKLPLGSIKEIKPIWPFWTDYGWTMLLPLLYFSFFLIWKKHGKDDPAIRATAYYPPKNMDSAIVGYLMDDSSDTVDLISLIPYWAALGYLRIKEIDKKGWFAQDDTKLCKLKELEADAPNYQRQLFNGIFSNKSEVLVSSLKDKFHTTMGKAKVSLKDAAKIYYVNKSRRVRNLTILALVFLMLLLTPTFLIVWGQVAALAIAVSCMLLLPMSRFMIKKNKEGTAILSELKGFRSFIKVAEENKLKMLMEEDPTYFESTMSYALAFGMFDRWAKKFEALGLEPPTWYTSNTGRMISLSDFSNSFSGSMDSAKSTMVSSPSSSGSSGGGFGGGGGGSW